jgi:type III restriction enzyme
MINPITNDDLILNVKSTADTVAIVDAYDAFLEQLFDKEYYFLKDAARNILHFLHSSKYSSTLDLAIENFSDNPKLAQKYQSSKNLISSLQLPNQKSCSVDLATGTGKSYLIYAIAQIAIHSGLVDSVLVLSPSVTIEKGLTDKFNQFAGNADLRATLPSEDAVAPRIINANQTILSGDICVENIHVVYANTNASIGDSLRGKGERTLILNDEAHHIFNKVSGSDYGKIKEWKKFLQDSQFGFKNVVNFTGTPYIIDDYFSDVVYRYPISKAIADKIVKMPSYLIEVGRETKMKGFDEIYRNHTDNVKQYSEVKPLTIVITSDIDKCYEVWDELVSYISKHEKISREVAEKKCIWVVSGKPTNGSEAQRKENMASLQTVDSRDNPVEFIVSVAMLTEGWDVKNVFQIVPHDSRAFNSKLLISQVLGRGLRVPKVYVGRDDIKVKIFNHVKFSSEIESLFNDVLEVNNRLPIVVSKSKKDFNFKIHNFSYEKDEGVVQVRQPAGIFTEQIALAPQAKTIVNEAIYKDAYDSHLEKVSYITDVPWLEINEAAKSVFSMLLSLDLEQDKSISSRYPLDEILRVIRKNLLEPKDDFLSDDNLNRVKGAFRKLYDVGGETIIYRNKIDGVEILDTSTISVSYTSGTNLRKGSSGKLFYKSSYEGYLSEVEANLFTEMVESDDYEIVCLDDMKTPFASILTNHSPEKKFVNTLLKQANSQNYDSFIKNADKGFYSLPYSFKKGTHMKYLNFNPDFFIEKSKQIIVVEIKSDTEDSFESRAKLRDALKHFDELNSRQKDLEYLFFMLSPQDYELFFLGLSSEVMKGYTSDLMKTLLDM